MHKHIFTLGLISASLCTMTAMATGLPSFDCTDVWMDQNKNTPAKLVCADCCYNLSQEDEKELKCLSLDATHQDSVCWLPPAETYFDDLGRPFKHSCGTRGEGVDVNGEGEMFCDSTIRFERTKNGKCEETGYKVSWLRNDFLDHTVGVDVSTSHIGYVGHSHDENPNAVRDLPQFGEAAPITPYGNEGRWVVDFTGLSDTVDAKMFGTSACAAGSNPGEMSKFAAGIEHNEESGVICWCKVTKVGNTSSIDKKLDKPWAYRATFKDSNACGIGCARYCATGYADKGNLGIVMRRALFKAWSKTNQ